MQIRFQFTVHLKILGSGLIQGNSSQAALAIAISSDSSDESVGSPPFRVILFGDIPTVIPSTFVIAPVTYAIAPVISFAAYVVETAIVASPTGLCGLAPYSDLDSDSPDEMASLECITPLPATSSFLFTDSSEDPDPSEASDSSKAPPSQDPYVTTVAHWRSRVPIHSSSPSDFPIAPVTAPPRTRRRAAILIQLGEAIPLGRPYGTRLNGPRRVMTARKRVGPLPARRLAWRRVSPCSLDHHPSSSSSPMDSLPVHPSGLDAPAQAHSRSSTRVVSLSTFYPLTTSESSSGDSSERPLYSSSHSVGPSRKRCRSPTNSVPSSTPVIGSLAPTRADDLPPCKRELDIVNGDDVKDHIKVDPRDDKEDFEASDGDTAVLGIDPRSVPMVDEEIIEPVGGDYSSSSGTRDGTVRSVEDIPVDLDDAIRDFYHHMSEVRVDMIVGIETTQRRLEYDQMIASKERVGMVESIRSLRLQNLKVRALLCIKRDHVDSLRLHMSRSQEEFWQIRDDRDDLRRKLIRKMTYTRFGMTPAAIEEMINRRVVEALEAHEINRNLRLENKNGNGNGINGGNGNDDGGNGNGNGGNRNGDGRGDRLATRECTYQDFMKCQPLNFKGTKGVVGLIRWCEKMETVFHISNYPERYQVKLVFV
uniref:Reverse transcriptase domain-containing protein n=1 Tax=Tanacetum cinerariifolium TaxID=118510 RepID=A0A699I146_TANCI|nr:hypothetical protein [Tanacetum cinerariifolium]